MSNNLDDLTIYITSSHRHDKLTVFHALPDEVKDKCILVFPVKEALAYIPAAKALNVQWKAVNHNLNVGKRQYCTEACPTKYFCMMDDDITFAYRENGKLKKANKDKVLEIFQEIYADLEAGVPLIGISGRAGNVYIKSDYTEVGRMHRIWFLNIEIFRELNIKLNPFEDFVMEDMHLVLTFLENGYKNRIYYKYAQDDRGSNSPGGCATYRTPAVIYKSAQWLAEHHPDTVHVVTKVTKTGWCGMKKLIDGTVQRTDVHVQWKKAYKLQDISITIFRLWGED